MSIDNVRQRPQAGSLPSERPPIGLGRRFRQPRTLISFLFAVLIVAFLVRRLDVDPAEVWQQVRGANLPLLGLALAVFYGAFVVRALRMRWMLTRAGITAEPGVRLPAVPELVEIVLLGWFANCVVPARLGDVYRGYLLKRRAGAPFTTSMGVIGAERLIDVVVLVVLLAASGLVVFGRHLPSGTDRLLLYGGIATLAGVVAVGTLWTFRDRVMGLLPERFAGPVDRIQHGFFENLRAPWRSVGYTVVIWGLDGGRFFLVAWSVGAVLSPSTALFLVLVGALAAASPVTPAGLGVVEAVLLAVLPLVGVAEVTATAVVVLERVISYWSLIAVGLPLYFFAMRREIGKGVREPVVSAQSAPTGKGRADEMETV